jgi:hypothetical protein
MTFYRRRVLPCLLHPAMQQKQLMTFRRRVIGSAEGQVLEVGIGSGLNLPLYRPPVRSVEILQASAETLPFDDCSMDTVVMTWTSPTRLPRKSCAGWREQKGQDHTHRG